MSTRKTLILIAILAILGAITWYYTGPYQDGITKEQSARVEGGMFDNLALDRLTKVEVTTAEGITHTLVKNNNQWFGQPGNWPTETIIVDALEEKIGEMTEKPLTVASVNPANKPRFEVDEKGMQVKLYQGDSLAADFIVGKVSADYSGTYVSRADDDTTYITPVTLVRAFDVESWRDRTVTGLNDKAIDTVTLDYAGQAPVVLTTKEDTTGEIYWRMDQPAKLRLDATKVAEWLTKIAALEASGIPAQDAPLVRQLTVKISGQGISENLVIGGQDPATKSWYVKKESTGQLFLIADESKKELFKQVKDLQ